MHVLPPSFLFRYTLPVPHVDPAADLFEAAGPVACFDQLLPLTDRDPEFGRLAIGWSERGLGVGVEVTGKRQTVYYDVMEPWESDGLGLWIDTRNTGNVHRATRFCHHLWMVPGAVADGEAPCVPLPIPRAKEDPPDVPVGEVDVEVETSDDGYRLVAWLPPSALHGFDPESSPLLGFYWHLRDAELGNRYCTVGPDFPFAADPSLWITLELQK